MTKALPKPKSKPLTTPKKAKPNVSKPKQADKLNQQTVISGTIPKRISEFKTFDPKRINHATTVNAASLTMKLADDGKGNWRSTRLEKNFDARNPTFAELKRFLESKKAREIRAKEPIDGKYVCVDYGTELHNLAEKAGYRCGLVDILYTHGSGHVMCAFETIDKGLIFVDFAQLANYDLNGFIGKESKTVKDKFFKVLIHPHYKTPSGNRRMNIAQVTITW